VPSSPAPGAIAGSLPVPQLLSGASLGAWHLAPQMGHAGCSPGIGTRQNPELQSKKEFSEQTLSLQRVNSI